MVKQETAIMRRKLFWGITSGELLGVFILYVFNILLYATTLTVSYFEYIEIPFHEKLLLNTLYISVDYLIKFILTIPIWVLIFRVLQNRPLWFRMLLHIPLGVGFVLAFQQLYYRAAEIGGWNHLGGYAVAWDIYIPTLFYLIQFGIFHAYQYYRDTMQRKEVESELREARAKSELAALKAQLNPHFLYNVFNTISASVPPEQEKTREMIARLSDMFRYQLKATREDWVPLREELEFVQQYLELEKLRFGERLRVNLDIPSDVMDWPVPPLLLQPIVENSVKHGIAPLIDGGEISLDIEAENGRLNFTFRDTGVGLKDKSKALERGVGLSNTRKRLEKLFSSGLDLLDNHPRGLIVKFSTL